MKIKVDRKKLALGTAQFGLNYGIKNQTGQIKGEQVELILRLALESGITTLDTAIAYGESEHILGQSNLKGFSIVTKLPEIPRNCADVSIWAQQQLSSSLERLQLNFLDGLLLHCPAQLLGPFGADLFETLLNFKDMGLVRRIGVSIYEPSELDHLCEFFKFDLVQAPFNILDRRLNDSGWLEKLSKMGTALHIRSIFMQGLLLMRREERPGKFLHWDNLWTEWDAWLNETDQDPVEACLRYALSIPEVEKVIVGVDSLLQLQQIVSSARGVCPSLPERLTTTDPMLLNPSNWSAL